jgi:exodeoxyribonuclease VIII
MIKTISYNELTDAKARAGCFVTGMPNDAYHAHAGINKSGLDLVHRSPAHYAYGARREPTRAMALGTATHCAVLEPERFADEYLLLRDVKDRRASEYKQSIKVHDAERVLVSTEADKVAGMQESVHAQYAMPKGHAEISAFCTCPDTGVLMKARFDLLTDNGVAVDLKTTQDASREAFAKSVYNYRYHCQAAFYSRVYEIITGEPLERFEFLAVESDPPHATLAHHLDSEALEFGRVEIMRDLETYAQCCAAGEWPGYDKTDEALPLPAWAIARYENEIDEEIV